MAARRSTEQVDPDEVGHVARPGCAATSSTVPSWATRPCSSTTSRSASATASSSSCVTRHERRRLRRGARSSRRSSVRVPHRARRAARRAARGSARSPTLGRGRRVAAARRRARRGARCAIAQPEAIEPLAGPATGLGARRPDCEARRPRSRAPTGVGTAGSPGTRHRPTGARARRTCCRLVDRDAVDAHVPLLEGQQPRQRPEQRGLPCAVRPEHRHRLTLGSGQRRVEPQLPEGEHRVRVKAHGALRTTGRGGAPAPRSTPGAARG